MLITFNIKVGSGGNATVTCSPKFKTLTKGEDSLQFKSNDPGTVLKFGAKSPFDKKKFATGKILKVGLAGAGPFPVVASGPSIIKCGFINSATKKFAAWGGEGVVIPDNDGGTGHGQT